MKRRLKRILKTVALTALMSVTAGFPLANAEEQPNENYILGTFFQSNDDITLQCYVAKDKEDVFEYLLKANDIKGRDPSCQYYRRGEDDGYFYVCLTEPRDNPRSGRYSDNTFKIYRTTNFTKWEVLSFRVIDRSGDFREVWAPDLFIVNEGKDKGKGYVYFAKQKDKITKPYYEDRFNSYVCTIGDVTELNEHFVEVIPVENENEKDGLYSPTATGRIDKVEEGKIVNTINAIDDKDDKDDKDIHIKEFKAEEIKFDEESKKKYNNLIDAQVRYVKDKDKYYMVIKNEEYLTNNYNKTPRLFWSDSPDGTFTEVTNWPLKGIRGYEGFSIVVKNKKVYFYADNFSHVYGSKYDNVGISGCTVWVADESNIETGPYEVHYVKTSDGKPLRHGSVINTLDNKVIEDLGIKKFFDEKNQTEGSNTNENSQSEKSNLENEDKPSITLSREAFGQRTDNKKDINIKDFAPALDVKYYVIPAKKTVNIENIVNPYGVSTIKFKFEKKSELKIDRKPYAPKDGDELTIILKWDKDKIVVDKAE